MTENLLEVACCGTDMFQLMELLYSFQDIKK